MHRFWHSFARSHSFCLCSLCVHCRTSLLYQGCWPSFRTYTCFGSRTGRQLVRMCRSICVCTCYLENSQLVLYQYPNTFHGVCRIRWECERVIHRFRHTMFVHPGRSSIHVWVVPTNWLIRVRLCCLVVIGMLACRQSHRPSYIRPFRYNRGRNSDLCNCTDQREYSSYYNNLGVHWAILWYMRICYR